MKSYTLGHSKEQVLGLIPHKRIKLVQVGSSRICLTRFGDNFHAFEPLCPHQKASLQQGIVTGHEEVICPLHAYRFDLQTGQVRKGKCPDLKIHPTELTSEGLKISI